MRIATFTPSRCAIALLASVALLPLLSTTVFAQDKGLPKIQYEFSNGGTLRLYGQINKGILTYDDGSEQRSYGLIDNANSNTRVGLSYKQTWGDWDFENVNEFAYPPYSTADINIVDDTPSASDWRFSNSNIRKIDFTFANDTYGKFWLGQGSMATDGTLEVDLSGTDVIAYSSVADSAQAQRLRLGDGTLTETEIGDVFKNLDGDRRFRIRYDTPKFANFSFAAAYGRNLLSDDADVRDANLFDAAINYGNTFNDMIEVEASIGYNWKEGVADGDDTTSWGGSASGLHKPTGLNLTFSAGTQDTGDDSANYYYTKLGLLRDFVTWGATAMSIDYYKGTDFGVGGDVSGTDSKSWGLGLVQNVTRANTEVWLTYRKYDYSDNVASYDDGSALFGGVRFKF